MLPSAGLAATTETRSTLDDGLTALVCLAGILLKTHSCFLRPASAGGDQETQLSRLDYMEGQCLVQFFRDELLVLSQQGLWIFANAHCTAQSFIMAMGQVRLNAVWRLGALSACSMLSSTYCGTSTRSFRSQVSGLSNKNQRPGSAGECSSACLKHQGRSAGAWPSIHLQDVCCRCTCKKQSHG